MEASVIHHRLDLLLKLIDTTTGYEIEERDVHFYEDEKEIFPLFRGGGTYVFINFERTDRVFRIKAYGFEPAETEICYETIDSCIPIKEVFLIPSENMVKLQPVLTFSGKLPGISSIEAVCLEPSNACICEFDAKKRRIKLFRTLRMNTENIYYGLIHLERQTYEKFEVVKALPDSCMEIREPLKEEFSVNSPVARIVFGQAGKDGSYFLRVRDDREELNYLVRYVVNDEVRFQTIDFHRTDGTKLK